MNKIRLAVLLIGASFCFSFIPVSAQDANGDAGGSSGIWGACSGAGDAAICGDQSQATDIVKRLINVALFMIGVVSVVMIIHSGFKYVISRGDAEQIKSAKNTLLYSVVGLIVAILSFSIVNFVIGSFSQTTNNSSGTQQTNGTGGDIQ